MQFLGMSEMQCISEHLGILSKFRCLKILDFQVNGENNGFFKVLYKNVKRMVKWPDTSASIAGHSSQRAP